MLARRLRRRPNIKATLGQCLVLVEKPSNNRHWTNRGLLLEHPHQRWPTIQPTLVQRGLQLNQHSSNIGSTSHVCW